MIDLIVVSILAVLIGVLIFAYNKLVKLKNYMEEAWSGIDVQLKKRHNLIPNLVETVKGYAGLEKRTLEEVTKLRSQSEAARTVKERGEVENTVSVDLKKLFALVESYPNLKANQSFLKLQEDLTNIEDHIQYARRYYNGTVRNYNIAVESIPSNIVARAFKFEKGEFFEIEYATERTAPDVKLDDQ